MLIRRLAGVSLIALTGLLSACTSADPSAATPQATTQARITDSCINPTEITKQKVLSDEEIQFELRNGEVWINHLPRACPGLKFQQAFSWEIRGTLACSNQEMIRVKDEGTPCMLGEFLRLPPQSKPAL
ncbi:MAG TPA: DUF6491 family protein [Hyphomonadaceae bacterium]|nr:DUF6491 family protein [Hyphomonadaceae bacterium]